MAINRMHIQCVTSDLSPPPPPRLGTRLNASYAHANLIAWLVSIHLKLLPVVHACFNICIHNYIGSVQVDILNASTKCSELATTLTAADNNFTRQMVDPGIALGPVCIRRVVATTTS